VLKGIIRLIVLAWVAAMVAAAIAAIGMKRRLGPDSDESADDIVASAIFGPLAFHSTATNLRGGTLELWFGGGVLDLRDAVLDQDGAVLQVRAVFGGGQIVVPPTWRVISATQGLGGLQDTRDTGVLGEDAPTLTIQGILLAGGFAVQSELDEGNAQWLEAMESRSAVDEG
jgi:hypothetical protein